MELKKGDKVLIRDPCIGCRPCENCYWKDCLIIKREGTVVSIDSNLKKGKSIEIDILGSHGRFTKEQLTKL